MKRLFGEDFSEKRMRIVLPHELQMDDMAMTITKN